MEKIKFSYTLPNKSKSEIEGETFVDAIEQNINSIMQNVNALYSVPQDLIKVEATPANNKIVLSLTIKDSKPLDSSGKNHNADTILKIKFDGKLKKSCIISSFNKNPFADTYFTDINERYNIIFGKIFALLDDIVRFHIKGENIFSVLSDTTLKYPTMLKINVHDFLSVAMATVKRLQPNDDDETNFLLNRAYELIEQLPKENFKISGIFYLSHDSALNFLSKKKQKDLFLKLRKNACKTQLQVATDAGIQIQAYQRFESSERSILTANYTTVKAIANALNVSVDVFDNL